MHEEQSSDETSAKPSTKPLSMAQVPLPIHILCGWPLVMVAFGGALGGALGGAAYGVTVSVYQSTRNLLWTVICSALTGGAAIGGWMWMASKLRGE